MCMGLCTVYHLLYLSPASMCKFYSVSSHSTLGSYERSTVSIGLSICIAMHGP